MGKPWNNLFDNYDYDTILSSKWYKTENKVMYIATATFKDMFGKFVHFKHKIAIFDHFNGPVNDPTLILYPWDLW